MSNELTIPFHPRRPSLGMAMLAMFQGQRNMPMWSRDATRSRKNRRGIYTRQRACAKNGIRGAFGKRGKVARKRRQYTHRSITK